MAENILIFHLHNNNQTHTHNMRTNAFAVFSSYSQGVLCVCMLFLFKLFRQQFEIVSVFHVVFEIHSGNHHACRIACTPWTTFECRIWAIWFAVFTHCFCSRQKVSSSTLSLSIFVRHVKFQKQEQKKWLENMEGKKTVKRVRENDAQTAWQVLRLVFFSSFVTTIFLLLRSTFRLSSFFCRRLTLRVLGNVRCEFGCEANE